MDTPFVDTPFGPPRLSKGIFHHKMTTIVGNRGQLWTSALSPHLQSPHLDFPERNLRLTVKFESQDDGKGGLGLRGVAFMTVLAVLTVLDCTLPSFCLSYNIQCQETTVTILTVLAVSAVVAVSVVTATPLKLDPPLSSSWESITK